MRMTHHRCPGCRSVDVHNSLLACSLCWAKLPKVVRDEVLATSRYPMVHQRRREALQAAVNAWKVAGIRPS